MGLLDLLTGKKEQRRTIPPKVAKERFLNSLGSPIVQECREKGFNVKETISPGTFSVKFQQGENKFQLSLALIEPESIQRGRGRIILQFWLSIEKGSPETRLKMRTVVTPGLQRLFSDTRIESNETITWSIPGLQRNIPPENATLSWFLDPKKSTVAAKCLEKTKVAARTITNMLAVDN